MPANKYFFRLRAVADTLDSFCIIHFSLFVFPDENATYYQVHLVARNHRRGLRIIKELGLPDFHSMKDSNSLITVHEEFFMPFDFIHECVCLTVEVGK